MTLTLQGGFVMKNAKKKILPILVSTVAIVALAMTPALAKDSKNKKSSHFSVKVATETAGHIPEQSDAPEADHHDSMPGPAWKTIGGTVKKVAGDIYTVEDYEGNQVKLHVGQGTKHINKKKVGDTVRAEITRGGFANSIQ
jgi:ribosomal protein L21E